MITVEKALKSKKVKNATETGIGTQSTMKKKLLIGAVILGAGFLLFRMFKGNKNGPEKVYTPNT
jgi:hypothetical protein